MGAALIKFEKEFNPLARKFEQKLAELEDFIEANQPKTAASSTTARKVSRSLLASEYPFGAANQIPHIHHYPGGDHLKIVDRGSVKRYNIVQNGKVVAGAKEALRLAKDHLYDIVRQIISDAGGDPDNL